MTDRSSTHLPRIESKNDVLKVRTISTKKKQSLKRLSQNKNKSPGAGHPCLSVGQSAFPNGTPSRNVNSKGVTTAMIMIRMSLRGHQVISAPRPWFRPKLGHDRRGIHASVSREQRTKLKGISTQKGAWSRPT